MPLAPKGASEVLHAQRTTSEDVSLSSCLAATLFAAATVATEGA